MPLIAKIEHYEDRARFCLEDAIAEMRNGHLTDGAPPLLAELKATVDMLYDVYAALDSSMPSHNPGCSPEYPSALAFMQPHPNEPQPAALPPS